MVCFRSNEDHNNNNKRAVTDYRGGSFIKYNPLQSLWIAPASSSSSHGLIIKGSLFGPSVSQSSCRNSNDDDGGGVDCFNPK